MTTLSGRRRGAEIGAGLLAVVVTVGGYVLVALADGPTLPPDLLGFLGAVLGLYVVAHLAVRRFAPRADATLLPLAALLNGLGFVTIVRLDRELARIQSVWVAVGVAALVATLVVVRDVGALARYRYTFALLGVLFLLLPLAPGLGATIRGARLWVRAGPISFQPGEIAKVLLVLFFAGYLVEKRELLAQGTVRLGRRLRLPDPKHLGPLLLAWGISILVMVRLRDLGSSLLFFAVFALMLYMATDRAVYLVGAFAMFFVGAAIAYQVFDHVQVRVSTWIDPWADPQGDGFQIIQSMFAFGTGGVAGTGLARGSPDKIPAATTDFVFAAVGEELGLLGALAMLMAFLLLVGSALRIAIDSPRPFEQLAAAGLATIIAVQTFIILGGVTRLIPLTGLTTPFVSYGGSALVANFVLLGLLLRISDDTEVRRARDALDRHHAERRAAGAVP
jgi:cell division protein FtsW (lipid II flippase)